MPDYPSVKVPDRAIPIMRRLVRLDPEQRARVGETLEEPSRVSSVAVLRSRLAAALGDDDDSDREARALVGELFGLASLATSHGYSHRGVADAIAATERLELPAEAREDFAEFFAGLLDSRVVATLGKAADLALEYERVLHTARIVSEIVPVFDEPNADPVGSIVMNRMRLTFWRNGRVEDFELALTASQLDELETLVARAKTKATSLEGLLDRVLLPRFEMDEGEESHG